MEELRSEMQAGHLTLFTSVLPNELSPMQPVRRVSGGGGDYQQMLRSLQGQQEDQRLV